MPFAGYANFAACVRANADKEDPKGYCATIMRAVEGPAKEADLVLAALIHEYGPYDPDAYRRQVLGALIAEKSSDDHFYGAWKGGKKSAGGHPADDWGGGGENVSPKDAISALAEGQRPTIAKDDVASFIDLAAKRSDNLDITELHVEGTPKFGRDGLGIKRKDMPVLSGSAKQRYFDDLKSRGIGLSSGHIDPHELKPAQSEVSANKVAGIVVAMRSGKYDPGKGEVVISKDNYVLDGHHRWGAATAYRFEPGGKDVTLPYTRIDLSAKAALKDALAWNEAEGITTKALGESYARIDEAAYAASFREFMVEFIEKSSDDHFYGAWKGGSAKSGGGPSTPSGDAWPEPDGSVKGIEDAASAWSGTHFADIRHYMRTGRVRPGMSDKADPIHGISKERTAQSVSTLTHVIAKGGKPTPDLYRGVRAGPSTYAKFDGLKVGQSLDMSLSSWSDSASVAREFSTGFNGPKKGGGPVMLELASGGKGFRMGKYSLYQNEREWITDGRFKVQSVTKDGDLLRVRLTQTHVFDKAAEVAAAAKEAAVEVGTLEPGEAEYLDWLEELFDEPMHGHGPESGEG